MSYAEPADSGRKIGGFVAVVIFHVILIYALVNGLARKIVEVIQKPLETKLIEEVKAPPPDKPPPPPPPKLAAPPPPFIPPPEVQVQVPQAMLQNAITAVSNVKPAETVPFTRTAPAAAAPSRTSAVVDARGCAKPEYPPAALRAQETGTVALSFLIDVDGRVLEGKVERSSGSRRLDEAARKALSLCKFKPATADGKPEQSWSRIEYEWKIE